MGRRDHRPPPKRGDLDLSALMNVEQKNQLHQLINVILESMQKNVRDIFDNMGNGRDDEKEDDCESQKEIAKPLIEPTPVPAVLTAASANGFLKIPKSIEEATNLLKKDESEILTSSLNELKRDALTNFGKWRGTVLRRFGDITIKNGGNGGNVTNQGPHQQQGGSSRRTGAVRGRPTRPSGGDVPVDESNAALIRLYPPSPTPLVGLPKEKRALILHSVLLMLLGLENYSTYSRILLLNLASSMHIPMHVLAADELRVANGLAQVIKGISAEEIAARRAEEGKLARRYKVPPASTTNITTFGVNGGLAAPLASLGIGTVFGGLGFGAAAAAGLLGTMAESTVVVGTLFGLYGARATGKMADSYAKDVQDFGLPPLHGSLDKDYTDSKDVPAEDRRLRFVLCIAGWLAKPEDIVKPWLSLKDQSEAYALRWEIDALMKMSHALSTVFRSAAWTAAKKEIVGRTVFQCLEQNYWPIDLLQFSKVIDNPWSVGMVRADKAGLTIADAIVNKIQGERGITLIGFSLGARIIYSCLMSLAEKRIFGVVENVVLMGAPCPTDLRSWAAMKSVVTGRLVNVYSKNDYLLGFLSRSSCYLYGVAGLSSVSGIHGVENLNVSDTVTGHLQYQYHVGSILKSLGWEDLNRNQIVQEQQSLAMLEEEEKRLDQSRTEREAREALARMDLNKGARKTKAEKDQEKPNDGKKKAGGGGKQNK
ncbi:uncharacterized protein BCR38DRAFT_343503 [Pseudomassariella vexata]|uniref:DUF726 domain-containing protein n=1 Tax=Pseudomassariella vexata TaxID=1141098 RepID=A0A1Y2DYI3_9PEZI|nr:uncharacterized protein BCR38DRAFT_343503 [Pseudomassariella vexata]ORY64368.1 hypothetical protein BCR38DRAFT_343503 [Pseudomassariella vexata]